MGCDIHMVLEVKYENKWIGINTFAGFYARALDWHGKTEPKWLFWLVRNRSYDLFAKLAGVRGDGPPPRGIPEDVSDLAVMEIERFGLDGHSHSWGLLSEIGGYFLASIAPAKVLDKDRLNEVRMLFGLDNEEAPLEECRLVYFFDN